MQLLKIINVHYGIFNGGNFDDSGYEFDHIDEFSITKNNDESNIQALCPCCHSFKTRRFRKNKGIFTTRELIQGTGPMEIDEVVEVKKKRKCK